MAAHAGPALSAPQLARLGALGEERTARVGDVLYRVGDRTYPFIAILDGEVEIIGAGGQEILRHGPSGFLGELNLLTGQTVFVTAVVTKPLRYVAVDRDVLRKLLFEDGPFSDLVLAAFMERREALQQIDGIGLELVGPRSSEATMQLLDFVRRIRVPYTWEDAQPPGGEPPLVRLPGGGELRGPSPGQLSRALGIGRELAAREEVDLVVVGGGPAGLGAAVYGASEGLDTLVVESTVLGGQAGASRRIENYLGFPAGITGGELTSRAITQARKFGARVAARADLQLARPDQFLPILLDRHVVTHRVARRNCATRPAPLSRAKIVRRQMFHLFNMLHRPDVLYAPPLARTASVVRDRGHIADRGDGEAGRLQRAQRRFTPGAGPCDFDFERAHAVLLRLLGRVLGGDLRRIRRRLARTLETHRPRRRPGDGVALYVGDRDHRVVERRIHMRDAGGDVLAFAPPDARGFLSHSEPFRGAEPAVPVPLSSPA